MELAILHSFSILLLTWFLFFIIWILKNTKAKKLPTGPWKLPVIGNLHQIYHPFPHQRLRDLSKQYGPLMHLQIGQLSTVVVSSPEIAFEVLRTHDVKFSSHPYNRVLNVICYKGSDLIFCPYGDLWRKIRKICASELLSMKRVESFRWVREEEVSDLINWIKSRQNSPIDLTERLYALTSGVITRAVMGTKYDDCEAFASCVKQILKLAGGFSVADMFPSIEGPLQWMTGVGSRLKKLQQETDRVLESIINGHYQRRQWMGQNGNEEDLVDVLLKFQEEDDAQFHLAKDSIKGVLMDHFMAGIETTTTALNWTMVELIKNPAIMEKAQDEVRAVFNRIGRVDETGINEMKYLNAIIKESLRLHPPVPLIPRECGETCEIKGFEIPVKTRVLINAWAVARDSNYWRDPDSFIPERFLDDSFNNYRVTTMDYLPFGGGRRLCPGTLFSSANMTLSLGMLLYHFDWKLPNQMKPEDLNTVESFSITVGRQKDLYLVPTAYNP